MTVEEEEVVEDEVFVSLTNVHSAVKEPMLISAKCSNKPGVRSRPPILHVAHYRPQVR